MPDIREKQNVRPLNANSVLAVDVVLFSVREANDPEDAWQVLLVKSSKSVFDGKRALPGVIVREDEKFEEAARRLKGEAILAKVDSDASPLASSRFGIRSIPTLVLLRNGKEIKRQAGAVQAAQIVSWVQTASQPA